MTLLEWLDRLKKIHNKAIDLGLDRVFEVAKRLEVLSPNCPVITVGGTNGKGSTVAGLEAIYREAGYRVGAFTSPILFRHNELVRVEGAYASDQTFCDAYEKIEKARGDISLTSFEFNTLAAMLIFQDANLDVWLLEVGLGGRLDAVNIIDADVSIVTTIALDHTDLLGKTREAIAKEKAGIFRRGTPAISGDFNPPTTLEKCAKEKGAVFYSQGKHFGFRKQKETWVWWNEKKEISALPYSSLALQNMATVLMGVDCLQSKLPVTEETLRRALSNVSLPGRIQVIEGDVTRILDVSHNPASAAHLHQWLKEHPCPGKTRAVFSMLADKDIIETLQVIKEDIDEWFVAPLFTERAATKETLFSCFEKANISHIKMHDSIAAAAEAAMRASNKGDRVVVFGSFHVVAEAFRLWKRCQVCS
jgi:dihydrofolate synthase/folylpolyglutamate synthase